jgi:hypothetical protein
MIYAKKQEHLATQDSRRDEHVRIDCVDSQRIHAMPHIIADGFTTQ